MKCVVWGRVMLLYVGLGRVGWSGVDGMGWVGWGLGVEEVEEWVGWGGAWV